MELLSAPRLLWNQNLHCHTHSSPPVDRIPSRLRSIPQTSPHVFEIRFKIILRSTPKCSKWYIIFRSACQNLAHRITKSKFNQHGCWGQGGRRFLVLARCSHTVNCCDAETVHRPERSETHRRKIRSDETKLWRNRIQDLRSSRRRSCWLRSSVCTSVSEIDVSWRWRRHIHQKRRKTSRIMQSITIDSMISVPLSLRSPG
jgi:hypothetical protein